MKSRIIIQKGFIQIPFLIAILVSVVVASGISYGAIEYYKTSKILKEAEQLTKEEKYDQAIQKLKFLQNKWISKIFKQEITRDLDKNKKLLEDKLEYTQGIEEFNKGNWQKAKESLSRVSENSPYFKEAKTKIKEADLKIEEEKKEIQEIAKPEKEKVELKPESPVKKESEKPITQTSPPPKEPTESQTSTLENGLILYYTFDEVSGGLVNDFSGNNNSGTLIGELKLVEGKIGKAIYFDGVKSFIQIPGPEKSAPVSIANLSEGTIAFWFKFEEPNQGGIFLPLFYLGPSPKVTNTNQGLIIEIGHKGIWESSRELFFTVTTIAYQTPTLCFDSGFNLTPGQWYHFAVTVNRTKNTGYLNGKEMTDRQYNFGNSTMSYFLNFVDNGILSIGYGRSAIDMQFYYFKGAIDDLRIYNRALSPQEVEQLFKLKK